jgi:hypothetical protein
MKPAPSLPFGDDAAVFLRRAAVLAGAGPAELAHLRAALSGTGEPPESATLRATPAVQALLARAHALALDEATGRIERRHLIEALLEAEVAVLGLDLNQLRFQRWRLGRQYGQAPGRRQCLDAPVSR